VWDEHPRELGPEDIAALEHFARDALALLELRRVTHDLESARALLAASGTVLEMILAAAALPEILDTLARALEASLPTRCSILLLDGAVLHHGAGPSLPRTYLEAIDGVRIGPAVGSCGTAAYTKSTVIVADIAADPRWVKHRQDALAAGLRACWSIPILGPQHQVLGTFAVYYDTVRSPSYEELSTLSRWVNLAELAIIRSGEVASLRAAATVDPLTGLINRAESLRLLERATENAGAELAVFFLDLDQFKFVNDTLGHAAGDEFLQAVASRLIGCLRPHDTVARFGGDEFLMLCPDICSADQARTFGRRIIAALAEPLPVYGRTVALSVSIGIALHPAHSGPGAGAGDLVAEADLAMYSAKRSGRNNIAVFDADLRRQAADRLSLEADLSRALINDELHCHYQPIVDLPSGQLIGLETLLRWRSPTRGTVLPLDFIPTAEDSGLICPIGAFVLRTACRQLATWNQIASGMPAHVGEHIPPPAQRRRFRRHRRSDPAPGRPARRATRDRGYRKHPHPRRHHRPGLPEPTARPRRQRGRRRLRHRLPRPGAPEKPARGCAENRPRIHHRHQRITRRYRHRRGDPGPGRHRRPAGHRRRHRNRCPTTHAAKHGLQRRAGLPVQPLTDRRPTHRPPAC